MHETLELSLTVNDRERALRIEPRETLGEVLRDRLGMTGTKISCDAQVCGACTVLVDDLAVSACTYLAIDAESRTVRTVEGLGTTGAGGPASSALDSLDALQAAFLETGGAQCGICTPGMLMSARAYLDAGGGPDEDAIRDAIAGNLCRCTGYTKIIDAIALAARRRTEA